MKYIQKKVFKTSSITEAMKENDLNEREILFEKMMCDHSNIRDQYKGRQKNESQTKEQYASVPSYLIPVLDDGYKKQNTLLASMYIFGCKKLLLNLEKINSLFGVNYKTLSEAKANMFEWCWEELGINCDTITTGRRVVGYKITPNYEKISKLSENFENILNNS